MRDIFTEKGTFVTDLANQTQRLALDIIGDVAFSYDFKETEQIRRSDNCCTHSGLCLIRT